MPCLDPIEAFEDCIDVLWDTRVHPTTGCLAIGQDLNLAYLKNKHKSQIPIEET